MASKHQNMIVDFILEQVPDDLMKVYELLCKIKYPLNDKKSFFEAIEAISDTKDETALIILRISFSSNAFPVASPRNAMERVNENMPPSLKLKEYYSHVFADDLPEPIDVPGEPVDPIVTLVPTSPQRRRVPLPYRCVQACQEQYQRCMARAVGQRDEYRCEAARAWCLLRCRGVI